MSTSPSTPSRIPIRAYSYSQSPKPRHLRLLHSGLITIPEGSRQSSADAVLTRMPRVRSSDGLYKSTTDKLLPQLPQPDVVYQVTPENTITSTIRKVSNTSITEETAANTIKVRPPIPTETIPYEDSAWQDFHIQDQKLTKWTLSTNLKTAMDQTETHLHDINNARVKYDCLISLCKGMLKTNSQLQTPCQRAIDQHQALAQKETQLRNASNFVREHNDILITKCRIFLTDTANSHHKLQDKYEKTLAHAKESTVSEQGKQIPKRSDLCEGFESVAALNKDIGTVVENITSINGLLSDHKHNIDTQATSLNAEIIKLASKKGSSTFRKILCFQ